MHNPDFMAESFTMSLMADHVLPIEECPARPCLT
jgi:hypothetical protein